MLPVPPARAVILHGAESICRELSTSHLQNRGPRAQAGGGSSSSEERSLMAKEEIKSQAEMTQFFLQSCCTGRELPTAHPMVRANGLVLIKQGRTACSRVTCCGQTLGPAAISRRLLCFPGGPPSRVSYTEPWARRSNMALVLMRCHSRYLNEVTASESTERYPTPGLGS